MLCGRGLLWTRCLTPRHPHVGALLCVFPVVRTTGNVADPVDPVCRVRNREIWGGSQGVCTVAGAYFGRAV